jgi:schlafen family protein
VLERFLACFPSDYSPLVRFCLLRRFAEQSADRVAFGRFLGDETVEIKDEDLLVRLRNDEDQFTERKSFSDNRGWLRTAVAFANSASIGYPAVLFVGARSDGTPEDVAPNLDTLQQSFSKEISQAYPPIPHFPKVLIVGAKRVLAIVIPGSADRPHFAGHSYVRVGSETRKASEEQFIILLTERNSKGRKILEWKDKEITVRFLERMVLAGVVHERGGSSAFKVVDCSPHYVTLERGGAKDSVSLESVKISYDFTADRLRLEAGLG